MACYFASLVIPATTTPTASKPSLPLPSSLTATAALPSRRHLLSTMLLSSTSALLMFPLMSAAPPPALAANEEEYVKDTSEVINKVRTTINMDKNDPNVAEAVAELRQVSNDWVAKYRREKDLLGRPSFRDMYSALNAVSGHYISFGPTAPIPAKRKARILEEMDSAEKAIQRGR